MNPDPLPSPLVDPLYLWLGLVGVAVLMLLGAYAYVLLHRHRDWLAAAYRRVDAWMERHAPRPWQGVKHRFTREAWYGLSLTVSAVLIVAFITLFVVITESWTEEETLYRLDQMVLDNLDALFSEGAVAFFRIVTHLADVLTAVVLSLALLAWLAWQRNWERVVALVLAMGGGQAVLWTLKWAFGRDRPGDGLIETTGRSFPSGHSFTALVLYGFVLYLVWHGTRRAAARWAATLGLPLLIVAIGLSRIVLRAHWVSDVVGGFAIGLAWLVLSLIAARAWQAARTR